MTITRKVYIEQDSENKYFARDIKSGVTYRPLTFLRLNDTIITKNLSASPALLLETGGQYFVLGYFTRSQYQEDEQIVLVDGEAFIKAGETRAIVISPTGTIGIYDFIRKPDGTIVKTPKFLYDGETDDLIFNVDQLILSMYGAGSHGNVTLERDAVTGNFSYKIEGKTSDKDGSPRFSMIVANTISGPVLTYKMDNVPSPINPAFKAASFLPVTKLEIKLGSQGPTGKVIDVTVNELFEFTVDMLGNVALKSGPEGLGVIEMKPTGQIDIKSGPEGLGTVQMLPTGAIKIAGKAGVSLKGPSAELMTVLADFIQLYMTHVVPTGTGPSGPPVNAAAAGILKAKVLAGIKGTA